MWGSVSRYFSSSLIQYVPGSLVFMAYVLTGDLQVLSFAFACLLWPTFRSLREL